MMATTETQAFVKNLNAMHQYLKEARRPYEPLWSDVIEHFRPVRAGLDSATQGSKGARYNSSNYSSAGALANQQWSRGIIGNMVYPKSRWLDVALNDRKLMDSDYLGPQIRDYLQDWADQAFYAFNRSHFHECLPEMAADAGAVGGCLCPYVKPKDNTLHWLHRNPGRVWISVDFMGEIERVHEEMELTASALEETFGADNLSTVVNGYLRSPGNRFTTVKVVQCFFANPDYDPRRPWPYAPEYERYAMVLYEAGTLHLISRSGVPWLPLYWRVHKLDDWWYGISPGMGALSDARMDNVLSESLIQTARLTARPPMLAHSNLRGKLVTVPNGKTYYNKAEEFNIRQLYDRINWSVPDAERTMLRDAIKRWYSVDFFMLLTSMTEDGGNPPTAYQIRQVQAEKMTLLGPQVGTLEGDVLNPGFDVIFEHESRYGTPPEMPDELVEELQNRAETSGVPLESIPEFTGLLAQIQKETVEGEGIDRSLMRAAAVLEIFPEAKYVLKQYQVMRNAMQATNLDQDAMRSEAEYRQFMEAMEANAQLQQQAALGKDVADAYSKVSQGRAMEAQVA